MVGGHVSLDYSLRDRSALYATLSRGYKAGGFNIGANVPEGRRSFDAEYLWNLETGYKGRSGGGSSSRDRLRSSTCGARISRSTRHSSSSRAIR